MAGFALEGPKWAQPTITWSFATTNFAGQVANFTSFMSPGVFENEVARAFARWEQVANIHFVQVADGASVDIRLGYATFDGPFGQAGDAAYFFSGGSFLPGAVVRFDSAEPYGGDGTIPGGVTFYSIALHEIGHALGLDHYDAEPAIMNTVSHANVPDLTASDIAGIQALYGAQPHPTVTSTTGIGLLPDFDGDGRADFTWRHSSGMVGLWEMNGTQIKATQAYSPSLAPTTWHITDTGDFNNDNRSDILWRSDNGDVGMWLMNGFQIVSTAVVSNLATSWHSAGIGDFNGNGTDDIIWRNTDGSTLLWQMDGASLQPQGYSAASTPLSWHIQAVNDFNGDNKADILWRNDAGTVAMWLMNGLQPSSTPTLSTQPADWFIAGSGDFNGDGNADILWRHTSGTVGVWLMNGSQVLSTNVVNQGAPNNWHISGTGDFNNDGRDDIAWRDDSGLVGLWLMNGTAVSGTAALPNAPTDWLQQGLHYDIV